MQKIQGTDATHQQKKKKKKTKLKMSKGPEQIFFQRGYANGQQAYEKVLNITNNYQRKAY